MQDLELPEVSTLHGLFAQARVQPETITIFRGWTRLTTDNHGEMDASPTQGLFCGDTRFMTVYRIKVNGKPVRHRLSAQLGSHEWTTTGAIVGSADSGDLDPGVLPKGAIEARILRKIELGLGELLCVKNNGFPARDIHVQLELACPIADAEFNEEMKKQKRGKRKGVIPEVVKAADSLALKFRRNFGRRKHAPTLELGKLYGKRVPGNGDKVTRELEVSVRLASGSVGARIRVEPGKLTRIHAFARLGAREELRLQLGFEPKVSDVRMPAPRIVGLVPLPKCQVPRSTVAIRSGNATLDILLGQAQADLRSLRLPIWDPESVAQPEQYEGFSAGIPRYVGTFGRDTAIAARQSLLFEPSFAETSLSRLAAFQGIRRVDRRDEEPGRILHERRLDPEAQNGRRNRDLYYGDVTSTPFWVLSLTALYHWTGDRSLLSRHRQTLERCVSWINRRLEQGEGFIYYAPAIPGASDENRNQAWKDSGDAIVDENGRIRVPPLAVPEVQGYAYRALLDASRLLEVLEAEVDTGKLRERASELKRLFNERFWVEERNFYALALDHRGHPIRSRASNVGHCLSTGILEDGKVGPVIEGLLDDELFSGWGVRTLESSNPAYDPFSYHRGSVWPVENAMIAEGMASLGYRAEANRIITGQLCMAALFQHMRLPEVFGGQPRSDEFPFPGIYNFANLLQTWSVTAMAQFTQTILGLRPRLDQGTVFVDPALPKWLPWIELRNLPLGNGSLSLRATRESSGESRFEVLETRGELEVRSGSVPGRFAA